MKLYLQIILSIILLIFYTLILHLLPLENFVKIGVAPVDSMTPEHFEYKLNDKNIHLKFGYMDRKAGEKNIYSPYKMIIKKLERPGHLSISIEEFEKSAKLLSKFKDGEINLAVVSPAQYQYLIRNKITTYALVSELYHGARGYLSYIIAAKNAPWNDLNDANIRRAAAVSTDSTSGYLVPYSRLIAVLGARRASEIKISFLGSHSAVMSAVASGKYDIGFTYDASMSSENPLRNNIKIIAKTAEIPSAVIVCNKICGDNLKNYLIGRLVNLTELKGPRQIDGSETEDDYSVMMKFYLESGISGWVEVTPDDITRIIQSVPVSEKIYENRNK